MVADLLLIDASRHILLHLLQVALAGQAHQVVELPVEVEVPVVAVGLTPLLVPTHLAD